MTYEEPEDCSEELLEEIETTHSDLASDHGRDNVLVKPVGGDVVALIGEGVGLVEPLEVAVNPNSNQAK